LEATVYSLFEPLSQVTVPSEATWMNLYWMSVPAGNVATQYQSGFVEVYADAEQGTASEPVLQFPSSELLPVRYTFVPYVVVTSSLKITVVDGWAEQVGVIVPDVKVAVAVEHGPDAELPEHDDGSDAYTATSADGGCNLHP